MPSRPADYRAVTLCGGPFQVTSPPGHSGEGGGFATPRAGVQSDQLQRGLLRFRSPLLPESRLISFPPANDMLKFTGCSGSSALSVVSHRGLPQARLPGGILLSPTQKKKKKNPTPSPTPRGPSRALTFRRVAASRPRTPPPLRRGGREREIDPSCTEPAAGSYPAAPVALGPRTILVIFAYLAS